MNTLFLLSIILGLGLVFFFSSFRSAVSQKLSSRVLPATGTIKSLGTRSGNFRPRHELASRIAIGARKQNQARIERALYELPDVIELLAVCLEAGESSYGALKTVVNRSTGEVAEELRKVIRKVDFGGALSREIAQLPLKIPHPQFAELASKISLSVTRGTPLAEMLHFQSESLRSEIRNRLLKQVGKNETRMLIPLVFLILPITVLFAIYPSLKLLNFNYL